MGGIFDGWMRVGWDEMGWGGIWWRNWGERRDENLKRMLYYIMLIHFKSNRAISNHPIFKSRIYESVQLKRVGVRSMNNWFR